MLKYSHNLELGLDYKQLLTKLPFGLTLIDLETLGFVHFSDAACQPLDYTREEFSKLTLADLALPDPDLLREQMLRLRADDVVEFMAPYRRKDRSLYYAYVRMRAIEIDGRAYVLSTWRDVSELERLAAELNRTQTMAQVIIENAPAAMWMTDLEGRVTMCNDAFAHLCGNSSHREIVGQPFRQVWRDAASLSAFAEPTEWALANGRGQMFEALLQRPPDGRACWMGNAVHPVIVEGKVVGVVGHAFDITEGKDKEAALSESEEQYRTLAENSPDLIIRIDRDLRRTFVSADKKLGFDAPAVGTLLSEVRLFVEQDRYLEYVRNVFQTGKGGSVENQLKRAGLPDLCVQIRVVPEFESDGRTVKSVLTITSDISTLVDQREALVRMAQTDALTGLHNRTYFAERMKDAVRRAELGAPSFGLLMFDLDDFKEVNDTLGHQAGDALLVQMAERLRSCLRDNDLLARFGGDEFAVLFAGGHQREQAEALAERLMAAVREPFTIEGRAVIVSCSIGAALYPSDGQDAEQLQANADVAMYEAKRRGRNNCQFYSGQMTAKAAHKLALSVDLREALMRGQMTVFYQPKMELGPVPRLMGAEALLRWTHPEHGPVPPDRFIPLAEETGVIIDLGRFVLDKATRAVTAWNKGRAEPLSMAVNLSPRQFLRHDIVGETAQIMMQNGCSPNWLELEITENLMLVDDPDILEKLDRLRALGLSIAIDDFGTGHSALGYLNRFSVDVLKIDRSFVTDMENESRKRALVRAFLSMADALDMVTVAEGVENAEQAQILQSMGCCIGQGYLFGKPQPLDDFAKNFGL